MASKWRLSFQSCAGVSLLTLGVLCGTSHPAHAQQATVRVGGTYAGFGGPITGSFFVPTTLDLEYEVMIHRRESFGLATSFAFDFNNAITRNATAGLFYRVYPWTPTVITDEKGPGFELKMTPARRVYFGVDFALAQVVVRVLSPVYVSVSQVIELGAHAGMLVPINGPLSLSLQVGAAGGYGFSSVGVTALQIRGAVGVSYLFKKSGDL